MIAPSSTAMTMRSTISSWLAAESSCVRNDIPEGVFSRFVDWLREIDYFARLADEDFREVAGHVHLHRYAAGQVVMLEGEPCEGLYVVREGRVRVYKMSPAGKERVLRIIPAGESFNDVPVFDGGPNPASADCLDDCELGILTNADAAQL